MTQADEIQQDAERLRVWANGDLPSTAGVELLIRNGKALRSNVWIIPDGDRTTVDLDKLRDIMGAWSGGERRVVAVALSLLDGDPVDLGDVVTGIDSHNVELVVAAIQAAAGDPDAWARVAP